MRADAGCARVSFVLPRKVMSIKDRGEGLEKDGDEG